MLYHDREGKNKENAHSVYIVYLLTKLRNIFDEAFFIDVSIYSFFSRVKTQRCNGGCNLNSYCLITSSSHTPSRKVSEECINIIHDCSLICLRHLSLKIDISYLCPIIGSYS